MGRRESATQHRFSVAPPQGFTPWEQGRSPTVPLAFKDTVTDSTFLVEWRATSDSAKKLKNKALRACADQFSSFHVVRDEPLGSPRTKGDDPAAWMLEVETRVGTLSVRQLQVFHKRGVDVAVLTYSGSEEHFVAQQLAIQASLDSFRFDAPGLLSPKAPEPSVKELAPSPEYPRDTILTR